MIAESFAVHRIKGTRLAVEKALARAWVSRSNSPSGSNSNLRPSPVPFRARLNLNDNRNVASQLSGAFYQQIHHAIQSAKNLRSHYTFDLSADFGPNRIGVASAQSAAGLHPQRCTPDPAATRNGY